MILKNKNNNFLLTLSIVLILMGIVIFSFFSQKRAPVTPEKASTEIRQIQTQSQSDDVEAIEKDINDTDLSEIDREISAIEKELNASY